MKPTVCKHCGAVDSHPSFKCYTQRKPIKSKPKVGDIVEYDHKAFNGTIERHQGRIVSIKSSNKPKKRLEEQSTSELKKLAQIVVNRHVKKLYTEYDGTAKCFTCDMWFSAKEMDASHLISVKHQSTRYDLDNLRLCCISCNRLEYGNLKTYRQTLSYILGKDHVDALYARSREVKKWTKEELLELIEKYK